jgi:hypothetical protein
MTPEVVESLEQLHPQQQSVPRCPADASPTTVESTKLNELIREGADGSKGGPSGWTCELLLPLLGDVVCAADIAAFVEDCCNGSHDPHSGHLIHSSLMAAANKQDPAKKRSLMMGEIWAKLASKYSKSLDMPNFKEVFEPTQTAVGAQGGPERVLQAMQAAVELRPKDVCCTLTWLTPTRA